MPTIASSSPSGTKVVDRSDVSQRCLLQDSAGARPRRPTRQRGLRMVEQQADAGVKSRGLKCLLFLTCAMCLSFASIASAQRVSGRALAEERCAMCHAIGPSGGSPHPAAPPFRKLGNSYDLDKLQTILERGDIVPAHPEMPIFKLDRNTARSIINYIRSIQE